MQEIWLSVSRYMFFLGTASVLLISLLPLVRSGWWVIRICDFPRIQVSVLAGLLLVLALPLFAAPATRAPVVVSALLLIAVLAWQFYHVAWYTQIRRHEVPNVRRANADDPVNDRPRFKLLIINLDFQNSRREEMDRAIANIDPDVLLLVEIDAAWKSALSERSARFPHKLESIRESGCGMALWSRLALTDTECRHLVSMNRPSLWCTARLPDGCRCRLACVHPTPPGLPDPDGAGRYDSRIRDAELVRVASIIASEQQHPWIVAGDFNDVAWSRTTELFREISGLKDPRIGRALLNTYHARYPLLRYPLDHVFLSEGFEIHRLRRCPAPGSDHFAVLTELSLIAPEGPDPEPDDKTRELADHVEAEGLHDAAT